MKKLLCFLLLAAGLPLTAFADDSDLVFENADKVIRCIPAQGRPGSRGDNWMARPKDAKINIGTNNVVNTSFKHNNNNSGKTIQYTRREILFQVLTADETTHTGTVALGGVNYYHKDKSTHGSYTTYCKFYISEMKQSYVPIQDQLDNRNESMADASGNKKYIVIPSRIEVNPDYDGDYAGYTFTVTELADDAFYFFTGNYGPVSENNPLYTLYLPQTITKIGNRAIGNRCLSLMKDIQYYKVDDNNDPVWNGNLLVTGPEYNSVTYVGDEAFRNKTYLTSVSSVLDIAKVSYWGENVFNGCSGFTSVDLSAPPFNAITKYPDNMFAGMNGLTSLEIPNTVTEVGAIWGTTSGTNNENITEITFETGSNLKKLDLRAFNLPNITSFTVPDGVEEFLGGFSYNNTGSKNTTLTSVKFSNAAGAPTKMPDNCFAYCEGLTTTDNITWGKITEIGDNAFAYSGLKTVNLPAQITSIGGYAFAQCKSLTSVTINGNRTTIPRYAFSQCEKLSNVSLPSSVTTLEEGCFQNCAITNLDFLKDKPLTTIGDYAFATNQITSLEGLPGSVQTIGESAFQNNAITEFKMTDAMKENLVSIGNEAFKENQIGYAYLEPKSAYKKFESLGLHVFDGQVGEFTAEFSDACTTVPEYIKNGNPFGSVGNLYYADDDTEQEEPLPGCQRIIVPMGSIETYKANENMSTILYYNYRVKFRWGTFGADGKPTAPDYDLYNITPQQRLIATAAWNNDVLNFRPHPKFYSSIGAPVTAKPHDFVAQKALATGKRKSPGSGKEGWYGNTVDVWDNTAHTATPVGFDIRTWRLTEDLSKFFDENTFNFNKSDFAKTTNATDYPQTLMPYTIHTYHANHGNDDEPEQLGRKPVEDGIVPYGTGIVIDYPKPGYYLVPPAFTPKEDTPMRVFYKLQNDNDNPIVNSAREWRDVKDKNITSWIDLRNGEIGETEVIPEQIIYLIPEESMATLYNIMDEFENSGTSDYTEEQKAQINEELAKAEVFVYDDNYYDKENETYNDPAVIAAGFTVTSDPDGQHFNKGGVDYYFRLHDCYRQLFQNVDDPTETTYIILKVGLYTDLHVYVYARVPVVDSDGEKTYLLYNDKVWESVTEKTKVYNVYSFSPSIPMKDFTRADLNDDAFEKKMSIGNYLLFGEGDFEWIDIDQEYNNVKDLALSFKNNHDSEKDHNVIIGIVEPIEMWPYWTASPYKWDGSHEDFLKGNVGRMGKGNDFLSIYGTDVNKVQKTGDAAKLDSDIQYVNFGFSRGYFVQYKSKGTTPANRAYFSIGIHHMPHVQLSSDGGDAKMAIGIIDDNGGTTGITDVTIERPASDAWYTINGTRLNSRPTAKGIYIHGGKKIVVK